MAGPTWTEFALLAIAIGNLWMAFQTMVANRQMAKATDEMARASKLQGALAGAALTPAQRKKFLESFERVTGHKWD